MAFRIKAKRYASRTIAAGADEVIYWCPIPAGGLWLGATLDIHVILTNTIVASDIAKVYGLSGYFVPVNDLTALPATPDLFWDTQITKDQAVAEDALDLSDVSDVTEDIGMGIPNLAMMVDAQHGPTKLFRTERLMSFASGGRTMVTTAGAETYLPIDRVRLRTKRQVKAGKKPGVVLIAISNGDELVSSSFDATARQAWAPGRSEDGAAAAELEWRMLKYMQRWIEDASMFLMPTGVEAGAQEPYEKAAELAGRTVEQAFEDGDGDFDISAAVQSFTIGNGMFVVPGRPSMKMLKGN